MSSHKGTGRGQVLIWEKKLISLVEILWSHSKALPSPESLPSLQRESVNLYLGFLLLLRREEFKDGQAWVEKQEESG